MARTHTGRDRVNPINDKTEALKEKALGRMRRMPRSSRYLFIAAGALLLVCIISIIVVSHGQAKAKAEAAYEAQVITIENRRDQAAAALIYHDDAKARSLYAEAERLLGLLPKDTPARVAQAQNLASDITTGLDQVRHVANLPNPPVAADLSTLGSAKGTALMMDGTNLYAFGSDEHIYQYSPTTKSFTALTTANGGVGVAKAAASEKGVDLFLDNRPGISSFDPTNLQQKVTGLAPTSEVWDDLKLYSGKLYVLSTTATDGRLLRFTKTAAGYSPASSWIHSKTSTLSNATSLAIDSTIFVLKKDGTVVRFAAGNQVNWGVDVVDPPISNATRIWTDTDSSFVYIMDPAGQRIVVFNKRDGTFVSQYRSDAFTSMTDFAVDEANKVMYVMSGSKLYAVPATHL